MIKRIVCFGDSNTYGLDAEGACRYDENTRWPCILAKQLGEGYSVVEEGLCGRTSVFQDPLKEGMAGIDYITPCMLSHKPIDLLIIMLGTNDAKERFSATSRNIADGIIRLAVKAQYTDAWHTKPYILLISPVPIDDLYIGTSAGAGLGRGCAEKTHSIEPLLRQAAQAKSWYYMNAADFAVVSSVDYTHLTAESHIALGNAVAKKVMEII